MNREIAVEILKDYGFVIETAGDGAIALDMVKNSRHGYYDLVLMDIQMPFMDGYTATREIRHLPDRALANVPIIAMTANAFTKDQKEAADCGMNGHIAKPIIIAELLDTLNKVLS